MNKKINYKAKEKISMVEESAYTRGPESLSDIDILSLIIGNKNKAQELLEAAGSMRQLRVWTHDQLLEFKGIGKKLGLRLRAAFMLESRCESSILNPILNEPEKVYNLLKSEASTLDHEVVWILILNQKNNLIRKERIFQGGRNSCVIDIPMLIKKTIINNGTSFMIAHNHPSENPAPSHADLNITKLINEAAKTVKLNFLDHIIIGNKTSDPYFLGYYSFRDAGVIN